MWEKYILDVYALEKDLDMNDQQAMSQMREHIEFEKNC